MNEQLTNKILERIDTDHLSPLPRWRFLLLRAAVWLLAALSVIVGSIAVAAMLFLFIDHHQHGFWSAEHELSELLLMAPFLWVAVFLLFIAIARVSVRHTKHGYRYSLRTLLLVSVLLSISFGVLLNFVGVGKITHEFFNDNAVYSFATYDSKDAWSRPAIGRLAGVVISIQGNDNFFIRDFTGHTWQVYLASSTIDSFAPEVRSTVRMLGSLESSAGVFIANSVVEWE